MGQGTLGWSGGRPKPGTGQGPGGQSRLAVESQRSPGIHGAKTQSRMSGKVPLFRSHRDVSTWHRVRLSQGSCGPPQSLGAQRA